MVGFKQSKLFFSSVGTFQLSRAGGDGVGVTPYGITQINRQWNDIIGLVGWLVGWQPEAVGRTLMLGGVHGRPRETEGGGMATD
jgi:hypothetical protein